MRLKSWRMPLKNSNYELFLSRAAVALVTVVFLSGCSRLAGTKEAAVEEAAHGLKKVAVLPFNNISGRKDAAKIVTNTYLTELFKSGRFRVEETGNVLQFMMQERIDVVGEMEIEKIQTLGKRLKVDGVLVGLVEEFDDGRGGPPTVSITARLVESESGRVVWSEQRRKRGSDYIIIFGIGEIRSATALSQRVVKEMIGTITW